VAHDRSILVYNTAVHRPSVQVNATVECVLLGVESHEVSSSSEGGLPNASIPRGYAEEGASISIKRLKLTGAAILVFHASTSLQAAPAA
jgi:hypothetical protein